MKIISDSSCNLFKLDNVDFSSVPLRISFGPDEFIDNEELDLKHFISSMENYSGKSSTACPNIDDWLRAFDDKDEILGVSLTSTISGAYNAAVTAASQYMEKYKNRKVFILDSLTTGPEQELIVKKYADLILKSLDFDTIVNSIKEYIKKTHLHFMLGSVNNFAKNGRVSPVVAKAATALNIKIVGQASAEGELEPLNKCHGEKKALNQLLSNIIKTGYNGGNLIIRHTQNIECAEQLKRLILDKFPSASIFVGQNNALCSYYAEPGSILVGFESEN